MIQETEDKDGEVCRDRQSAGRRIAGGRLPAQTSLELAEDICFQSEADDGLAEGDAKEGPRPHAIGHIHFAFARPYSRGGREALSVMIAPGHVGFGVRCECAGAAEGAGVVAERLVGGVGSAAAKQRGALLVACFGRYFGGGRVAAGGRPVG